MKYLIFSLLFVSQIAFTQNTLSIGFTRSFNSTGDYRANGMTLDYSRDVGKNWFLGAEVTWVMGYGEILGFPEPNNSPNPVWAKEQHLNLPDGLKTPSGEPFKGQRGILLSTQTNQDFNVLFPIWVGKQFRADKKFRISTAIGANLHYSDQRYVSDIYYWAEVNPFPPFYDTQTVTLPAWYFKRMLSVGGNLRTDLEYKLSNNVGLLLRGAYYLNLNGDQIFAATLGGAFHF